MTLAQKWQEFREANLAPDCDPAGAEILRQTFYAGALCYFLLNDELADLPAETGMEQMEALETELHTACSAITEDIAKEES